MPDEATVYDDLEVPTVVNATGTKTRISGSLMREEAADAMRDAARSFVRISDLQQRASELVAEATGADAGYVTSGASAALSMAAAACLAGDDLEAMAQLPDTEGLADEIVMPRTHRNGYDHALRLPGATIVDVGTNDYHLGTGSENVELWEIEAAITEETAAVAYMEKPYTQPPLETVCEIAHDNDIPVIVDAAAELPPVENLSRFLKQGADLVAYSGGKAIRGPQSTGILAGNEELIRSVARQHLDMHAAKAVYDPPVELVAADELPGVPRQGIGRSMKIGKEEIVGLIRALELFIEEDHDARLLEWHERAERIEAGLAAVTGLETRFEGGDKTDAVTQVVGTVDPDYAATDATGLVGSLRRETPRVFVGADRLDDDEFTINPMCLTDDEADYVVDRIRATLS
ncbi:aminotransferase class V-fold PLP-dependent enzyme [Natronococcus sp. JC468]|uniref:aminotransferase class V-fold PLP-dependent enzyme n=1 Tax=Natronococcus sp. JC468 TaxID=1961921 RepID=UPI001439BBCD|nr:aminotransferase class V-fold PLP-dependent enzyme [Natronococcus sp. JC468]NKE36108.1 aminotransferase class V-fold PLP-dependent enzyme [Natronococcus sp. JC468]